MLSLKQILVRRAVQHTLSRRLLNSLYLRLSRSAQADFHHCYHKVFRDGGRLTTPARWRVVFGGEDIFLPLRPEELALDWSLALCATGIEQEIKTVYERLLTEPDRPEVFVDVGGNSGAHSILFLRHGVEAITFEPNETCRPYFETLCSLNGVNHEWQPVALGDSHGDATLRYPENATWLGSTSPDRSPSYDGAALIERRVPRKMLDDYLPRLTGRRVLVKIDTEDSELSVLLGARAVIKACRPVIVFESLPDSKDRGPIADLFERNDYGLKALAVRATKPSGRLDGDEFVRDPAYNFLALPAESLLWAERKLPSIQLLGRRRQETSQ